MPFKLYFRITNQPILMLLPTIALVAHKNIVQIEVPFLNFAFGIAMSFVREKTSP